MSREQFEHAMQAVLTSHGVTAESHYVDVPLISGKTHVLTAGVGAPLVMVNGAGTPAAMFAPLMSRLDGYRIYGIDLPGYGLTDPRPDLFEDHRANAVAFLRQTLDALALDRPVILGNSLGSLWTLWLALDAPDRLAASIHVGCPAIILGTSAPLPMRLMSTWLGPMLMKLRPPSPRQVRSLSKMVHEHPLGREIVDLLVATERLPGGAQTFLGTMRSMLRLRGAQPGMGLTEQQLSAVQQPSLIVWGEDEVFGSPEVGRRMAAAMPNAELHIVPGAHAPWLKHSEQIAPLVRRFTAGLAPHPSGASSDRGEERSM